MNESPLLPDRIAFIGAGNMASSLIGGLLAKGLRSTQIAASEPLEATRNSVTARYGISVSTDNRAVVAGANVVVLAVKPQVLRGVAIDLAPALTPGALVISIAAGISLASLERWLGSSTAIVRCMPNTPALLLQGATGLYANARVSEPQRQLASAILGAVGLSVWLASESEIDAVTALSGSGPAYYFLLMEAMIAAGIELGLAPETARQLTLQTALGAATMAAQGQDDPATLRRKVTSPNGTTEQAIRHFQEQGFGQLVAEAMRAAARRSVTLSEELGKD